MPKFWMVASAILLLYVGFFTATHYWDGVLFSLYIEKVFRHELPPQILFHPNHLLYSAAGYVLYSAAGGRIRAITCLAALNAVLSTCTAALVYHWAKQWTQSRTLPLFATVLFACGATWWKFSTDAAAYVPAVFLICFAVYFALRPKANLIATGLCHIAAMLLHEMAIFAYVPICTAIWLRRRTSDWKRVAAYVTFTAAVIAGVYEAAYYFAGRGVRTSLFAWVTSFSVDSKTTTSLGQLAVAYPLSYLKLFVGGKLSLVRDTLSAPVVLAISAAALLLAAGIALLRRPRTVALVPAIESHHKTVLWAWVLVYALFLAWWEPASAFYKLFIWPPIVLLLAIEIANGNWLRTREWAFLVLSLAVAAWNFGAFIYPHVRPASDPVYALARRIDAELPKTARVYYKVLSPDDWYLEYFAPGRRWMPLPEKLDFSEASEWCLETTALGSLGSEKFNASETASWKLIDSKHNVQLACFTQRR